MLKIQKNLFFLVVLLVFSSLVSAQPTDYVAYWALDEGTGTTANDSSGNEYNGTISVASWTTGKSNGALLFDGSNDFVEVSSTLGITGYPFSYSLWFKTTTTTGLHAAIDLSDSTYTQANYSCGIEENR